ncbi:uncharacterized protein LOC120850842 [Ixodes scapularis]|uniref:uncharacterized protein LOC120850842 n=1 Tax=Ixodes scapularis TaxID=6945 RepID=UPI001A9D2CF4|nr:uncharacterized protein LOC120850842 [Ixodes scapularis]
MQLVVFAVVLILPSFLSGESFSSYTEVSNECELYIREGGDNVCSEQVSEYETFDPRTCTLICKNGETTKLPEEACSGGELDCDSEEVKRKLKEWILKIWARSK